MDILDRHDLMAILNDPDLRRKAFDAYSPMIDRLDRFFRVELPERERLRRAAAAPVGARTFTAIVRVLSPHNVDDDEHIIDAINAKIDAWPIRLSTTANVLDALTGLQNAGIQVEDGVPASETITKEVTRRAAGKKAGKASAKRRAWPRVAALTAVFLTACGGPMDDIVADDAPDADGGAELDADPDAPDAGPDADPGAPDAMAGGLPLGSACDVLAAECAGGLTCRIEALDPVGGECRTAGAALENDPCDLDNGDDDCGPAMACLGTSDTRCYVICDPADPTPRCGVADTCVQAFGPDVEIGACAP